MLSMLHRTNESRNDRMWRAAPWMLHSYNDAIGQACGQPRFLSGMHPSRVDWKGPPNARRHGDHATTL
jgi:hypothetical protein